MDRAAQRPIEVPNPYPERYRPAQEDPVVALLGEEYAIPADLQKYRTVNDQGQRARPDPRPKPRLRGREPLGGPPAYAVVDLPSRDSKGNVRGQDGKPLNTRVDPSAPSGILEYREPDSGEWLPQQRGVIYDDEAFEVRDLSIGQAARRFRDESRTAVISADALEYAMSPEGGSRFMPAEEYPENNPDGVAGWLRTTTFDRSGRSDAYWQRADRDVASVQQRSVAKPRYQMTPIYATDSVTEDGQALFRKGNRYPNDANAISAKMRELIPGAGTAQSDPLEQVQRNNRLARITPVRLQAAIESGFQVSEADPQTGVMQFQRPDGSSGLLVPEQILGKGGKPSGQLSPRFIVVDEDKMPSGETAYGPGAFLDGGSRAWFEKQSDLNPDGVSFWSAMEDLQAAGGTQPTQVRGREIVAQALRERGLDPSALGISSASQLADLGDAMRSIENRPVVAEQPVIAGMAPRGRRTIPGLQARSATPAQRAMDALYGSPSSPLPRRADGEADQLALALGLPAAREPVASVDVIPRAGWDALAEDFSGVDTRYSSGYGVIQRPPASALEAFIPIAKEYTFGDEGQAALIVEVAMRSALPGADGRVGTEQVINKILEIANPEVRTTKRPAPGRYVGSPYQQAMTERGALAGFNYDQMAAGLGAEVGSPAQERALRQVAMRVRQRMQGPAA